MASYNASSIFDDLPPLPTYTLRPADPLFPPLSDAATALLLPVFAYWTFSMFWHFLDAYDFFPQYRLHTPAEIAKRNRVTPKEVIRNIAIQQVIQTIVGLFFASLDDPDMTGREEYDVALWARRLRIVQRAIPTLLKFVGIDSLRLAENLSGHPALAAALSGGVYPDLMQVVNMTKDTQVFTPGFAEWELAAAQFIVFWLVPTWRFFLTAVVVDSWQYFCHRAMHMNQWLYLKLHAHHHRLYVPYSYGAFYTHPAESFILDVIGTTVAFSFTGMTNRQSIWFFTLATLKVVDDHSGYAFPWDPFQKLTGNNASFHDIHHQTWGIKNNFSQPFFSFWDHFLGTAFKGDAAAKYARDRAAAERAVGKPDPAPEALDPVPEVHS